MHHSEQLGIPIPKQFVEKLAEEIAGKVAARLKAQMLQVVPTSPLPPANQKPSFRPTFLRLNEVAERLGFSRSTIYNKMSKGKSPRDNLCLDCLN